MIYELRIYWANPGKLEALHNRFRQLTLPIFARHNMQLVAMWTPVLQTEVNGDLVYILAFPDADAVTTAWNAFRSDPEWITGKAASERDGSLTKKVTSTLLTPTDYSHFNKIQPLDWSSHHQAIFLSIGKVQAMQRWSLPGKCLWRKVCDFVAWLWYYWLQTIPVPIPPKLMPMDQGQVCGSSAPLLL